MNAVRTPLAAEPAAAELVLVVALARLEAENFLALAAGRERCAIDVGGAGPDATKTGPRRPHVVVHFPARSQAVGLVGRTDRGDDLPTHGVAKIGQAVERPERLCRRAEAPRR